MFSAVAISSRSLSSNPTFAIPLTVPTVAGTAPSARTARSASRATVRLSGRGRPCEIRVDSSATTGAPVPRASTTSARISTSPLRLPAGLSYAAGSMQRGSLFEGLLTKRLTG
jgi:hypothetical protein